MAGGKRHVGVERGIVLGDRLPVARLHHRARDERDDLDVEHLIRRAKRTVAVAVDNPTGGEDRDRALQLGIHPADIREWQGATRSVTPPAEGADDQRGYLRAYDRIGGTETGLGQLARDALVRAIALDDTPCRQLCDRFVIEVRHRDIAECRARDESGTYGMIGVHDHRSRRRPPTRRSIQRPGGENTPRGRFSSKRDDRPGRVAWPGRGSHNLTVAARGQRESVGRCGGDTSGECGHRQQAGEQAEQCRDDQPAK